MAEQPTQASQGQPGPIGRALLWLSEVLAIIGGIVLLIVTFFTVVSVVGRAGFNTPVLGDSEIVEVGVAFSIFSFLAYCQMRGANVIVDFFTQGLPQRWRNVIDGFSYLLFAVVVLILTWRLALGGIDAWDRGDYSMFLRIPLWLGYLSAFLSCIVWVLACLYTAWHRMVGDYDHNPAQGSGGV